MVLIARDRIADLFGLADAEMLAGHSTLADRYIVLARRIGMRYNVRMLPEYRDLDLSTLLVVLGRGANRYEPGCAVAAGFNPVYDADINGEVLIRFRTPSGAGSDSDRPPGANLGKRCWRKPRQTWIPMPATGMRKTNKLESSLASRSRGGRVAKGGRLKICSRRSSQVQILAPA